MVTGMSRRIQGSPVKLMRSTSECESKSSKILLIVFSLTRSPNPSLRRTHCRYIAPLPRFCNIRCNLAVMQRQFVGLGTRSFLTPCLSLMGLSVQTYNSLSQSPCQVAAYLQSTCWQGGRYLPCVHRHGLLIFCRV